MVVITLTDCPPKLKGDLSKWLCEISTGVYVGNLSARVRDGLWARICENCSHGRAAMVYSAAGEQGMEFRVHNTSWVPVDFDGIRLMKRPLSGESPEGGKQAQAYSYAERLQKNRRIQTAVQRKLNAADYVVLDLETSGLSVQDCEILELAALQVSDGEITARLHSYVRAQKSLPKKIADLTGITEELLQEKGRPLRECLQELLDFIGDRKLVCHNMAFDLAFIQKGCKSCDLKLPSNPCVDTLILSRRTLRSAADYKLQTLAKLLAIDGGEGHRAENDCELTYRLYEKLKEIQANAE